jgi:hypothetical protein
MKVLPILVALTGAACVATIASLPADAARSLAMKSCSGQWAAMKKANTVPEGETWSQFWSQCSKDFAAKNGGDTGTLEKAAPEKASQTKKPATTAAAEDDSPSSAQQKKDCDAKWDANKARTGAHGWHDYFLFMSRCM